MYTSSPYTSFFTSLAWEYKNSSSSFVRVVRSCFNSWDSSMVSFLNFFINSIFALLITSIQHKSYTKAWPENDISTINQDKSMINHWLSQYIKNANAYNSVQLLTTNLTIFPQIFINTKMRNDYMKHLHVYISHFALFNIYFEFLFQLYTEIFLHKM